MKRPRYHKPFRIFCEIPAWIDIIKALFSGDTPPDCTVEQRSMIVGREAFNFTLISTISFIVSFFLVHVVTNLFQVFYLHVNGVNFFSSLQRIRFLPGDQSIWDDSMILMVYGFPYFISLIVGVLLSGWLASGKKDDWRVRLFLIWLAIHAIMQFAAGVVYATFFYDGFGIAYHWLFSALAVRIAVTFLVLLVLFATGGQWMRQFLKASPTRLFFQKLELRYKFLWFSVLIPWVVGSAIILVMFYPPVNRDIFITLFCYLLIFVPMLKVLPLNESVRLVKSEKKVFPVRAAWIYIVLLLVLLRFVSRIEF